MKKLVIAAFAAAAISGFRFGSQPRVGSHLA